MEPNQHHEILLDVEKMLMVQYPSFHITHGRTNEESIPFLHLWKKKTGDFKTRLEFLPDFHIIVTLTNLEEAELNFTLYTFHGKGLCHQKVKLDDLQKTVVTTIDDLERNLLAVCRGFSDSQLENLITNLTDDTPLLNYIKRSYLIETLSDMVVVRSAECEFYCKGQQVDAFQCPSCAAQGQELRGKEVQEVPDMASQKGEEKRDSPPDISNVLKKFPGVRIFKTNKEIYQSEQEASFASVKDEEKHFDPSTSSHDLQNAKSENATVINFEIATPPDVKLESQEGDMGYYQDDYYDDDYDDNQQACDSYNGDPDFNPQLHCEAYLDDTTYPKTKRRRQGHSAQAKQKQNFTQFTCKVCFASKSTEQQRDRCMVAHERFFDPEEKVQCPKCKAPCDSRIAFSDHYKQEHGDEPHMCCCVCFKTVRGAISEMRIHIVKEHQTRRASDKGRLVKVRAKWVRNVYEVPKDGPPKKIDLNLLHKGYKSSMGSTILYECKICLRRSENWGSIRACFRQHERIWGLDGMVECPLCNKSVQKGEITHHFEAKHFQECKQCCCECLAVVESKEGRLRTHILKEHSESFRKILCTWCGRHFHNNLRLKDHVARMHEKAETFLCTECGKWWPTKVDLNYHMQIHNLKGYKCPNCDKTCKNRKQLYNHLYIHTNLKPFKCSMCDYSSCKSKNVDVHTKNFHGKTGNKAEMITNQDEYAQLRNLVKIDMRKACPELYVKRKNPTC